MTEEERTMADFMAKIENGQKIEANDWMPNEYRNLLIKQIHMHAVSEIMGAYPEKEWVPKAPTIRRKMALNAKVQDEIGHGLMLLRLAEDLSRPYGREREDLMEDLLDGQVKFHNVFHLPAPTWADAGVIAFLIDGGAIITQAMLLDSSYAPYARMLKRIVAEESFHMQYGESVVLALAEGTPFQRNMLQEAINRWWEPMMFFFGPRQMGQSARKMMQYKIRTKTNEELRQKFLNRYAPRLWALGLRIPDPAVTQDLQTGQWGYTEPNWDLYAEMVRNNNGPVSQSRLELRRRAHRENKWVREALKDASAKLSVTEV